MRQGRRYTQDCISPNKHGRVCGNPSTRVCVCVCLGGAQQASLCRLGLTQQRPARLVRTCFATFSQRWAFPVHKQTAPAARLCRHLGQPTARRKPLVTPRCVHSGAAHLTKLLHVCAFMSLTTTQTTGSLRQLLHQWHEALARSPRSSSFQSWLSRDVGAGAEGAQGIQGLVFASRDANVGFFASWQEADAATQIVHAATNSADADATTSSGTSGSIASSASSTPFVAIALGDARTNSTNSTTFDSDAFARRSTPAGVIMVFAHTVASTQFVMSQLSLHSSHLSMLPFSPVSGTRGCLQERGTSQHCAC